MPYIIYSIILFIIINLYFLVADRFNIVDNPCERSSHTRPVLRGGGIIFPLGVLLWFIWSGFQYPWFFSGLIFISFFCFLDDLSHVKLWVRLLTQIAAIILLLIQLGFEPMPWWTWVLALFVATGIINAFNFMDGINGITAGYSFSVLIGLWFVNNYQVTFVGKDLLYAIGLAIIIFSIYNLRIRARCFAGDVGSVSISFILVFLMGLLILKSGNLCYLMFLSIYGVDTFFTIVNRLISHENIFTPHRQHLFQILANEIGYSQIKVSIGYALVQLLINSLIIFLGLHLSNLYLAIISVGILLILSITYVAIKSRFPKSSSGI